MLKKRYPQNFIFKNPLWGSMIYIVCSFIFMVIYRPLQTRESHNLSYALTMAIYLFASTAGIVLFIYLIKAIPWFSSKKEWTVLKETGAVIIALFGSGIAIYLMGFIMEDPTKRLNLQTFINSCITAFFIGIIPFGFFSLVNYRHLLMTELTSEYNQKDDITPGTRKIQIGSKLKKEELSFFPEELIFAEADGNYVAFHLVQDQKKHKRLIRNSMSEIENQLSGVPFILRVHRAYIVNLKKVKTRKGNSLGYRLKMTDCDDEIPVSRQKVQDFDNLLNRLN